MKEYKQEGFFKRAFRAVKDSFNLDHSVVLKETDEKLITHLKNEITTANPTTAKKLEKELKLFEIGLAGERKVLFELKNLQHASYILHDYRFIINGQSIQIDFIVVTRQFIVIVEVKNYYGDIFVSERDEFIRRVYKGKRLVKEEGFYSPIQQVERQSHLLERFLKELGIIEHMPIHHVVVFSNDRTILHHKQASNRVRNHIVRADGLRTYIDDLFKLPSKLKKPDSFLQETAEHILENHVPIEFETVEAFEEKFLTDEIDGNSKVQTEVERVDVPSGNTDQSLVAALKQFRTEKSNELGVKPYYIFTNDTLDEIITKKPLTANELKGIRGMGNKKIEQFGDSILAVVWRFEE